MCLKPAKLSAILCPIMKNHFRSITLGFSRRWRGGTVSAFAAVGVLWTLTEMLTSAFPALKQIFEASGSEYTSAVGVIAGICFTLFIYEPRHVYFPVPGTDTKIVLKFGDLFKEESNLLIGVNEFFDGELGQPVSRNTLHGQFIIRNFAGNAKSFRESVDASLLKSGAQGEHRRRSIEPKQAFPIGTTVAVPNGQKVVFLMAMARTDLVTSKASSDVPTLWYALKAALEVVYHQGSGDALAMPLFGNGQAGIKLEPQHLLRLIVLALIDFSINSSFRLPKEVAILLHESCFEQLDIREIARDWKKS